MKGTTEDEMVGWHHPLDGHAFEQGLGDGDGQGSLACCSPCGRREWDKTEQPRAALLSVNVFTQAHLGDVGVQCSGAAATAEGSCANPAEGPRQACSPDSSEKPVGVEENIPTLAARPSEEVSTYALHWAMAVQAHWLPWRRGMLPGPPGTGEGRNLSSGCCGVSVNACRPVTSEECI